MSKIKIPTDLKGKELQKFVHENKNALLTQKKMMPLKEGSYLPLDVMEHELKISDSVLKAASAAGATPNPDVVHIKAAANTAWWCDMVMDVLIDDCWTKTIVEREGLIPHLPDHTHKLEAMIGDVTKLYSQQVKLKDLGLKGVAGSTQVLCMESDVQKSYNAKVFNLYKNKKVNQHSIGLQYTKIFLCINNEDYKEEFANWNKYFSRIINKDFVAGVGYFYAVTEIKLLEVSAVLFGCNILTGTLETETKDQPEDTLREEPSTTTEQESIFKSFKLII